MTNLNLETLIECAFRLASFLTGKSATYSQSLPESNRELLSSFVLSKSAAKQVYKMVPHVVAPVTVLNENEDFNAPGKIVYTSSFRLVPVQETVATPASSVTSAPGPS